MDGTGAGGFVNNFEIPTWAGKPPPGLHLDVMKETKMIQKLMIDEKKCYFFGRNKQLCDFCIDHGSCSRVHAALIWHKHLLRPFLIDLGSTHGTYIGSIRLDLQKPQQVPIDSEVHFGASTRKYVIRERPQTMQPSMDKSENKSEDREGGLLGLPETETEMENLTEFNTAHNRRVTNLAKVADVAPNPLKRKRKNIHVRFKDEEDVINPEDIDPSIGRFRNLVQTTVIPSKKPRLEGPMPAASVSLTDSITRRLQSFPYAATGLYETDNLENAAVPGGSGMGMVTQLGMRVPNLAPEVDEDAQATIPVPKMPTIPAPPVPVETQKGPSEPKKKKYAKEAWPGKKPTHSLFG